jgi:hypothetical protein
MEQDQTWDPSRNSLAWFKVGQLIANSMGYIAEEHRPVKIYVPDWLYADIECEDMDDTRYGPDLEFYELNEHPMLESEDIKPSAHDRAWVCIGEESIPINSINLGEEDD